MTLSAGIGRNDYIGNDSTDTYAYTFKIFEASDLKVIRFDPEENIKEVLILNTDYTVTGVGQSAGGNVVLSGGNLDEDIVLIILRNVPVEQDTSIRNQGNYFPEVIEDTFDYGRMVDQMLMEKATRTLSIDETVSPNDFNSTLDPNGNTGRVIGFNESGDGFNYGPEISTLEDLSNLNPESVLPTGGTTGQVLSKKSDDDFDADWVNVGESAGLPDGGVEYSILEKQSSDDGDADWTEPVSYDGISQLTNAQFTSSGIKDTLDKIIRITYQPPQVALSGTGSGTLRERGDTVTNPTLSATVTKRSDPIQDITFYEGTIDPGNIIDATHTSGPAIPSGGIETQGFTGSFSASKTFRVRVRDDGTSNGGTPQNSDALVTYNFVYPYYAGSGSPSLSAAAVAGLTKYVINESTNRVQLFNSVTVGQVLYFAYPASYGVLVSILDENNFENLANFTLRVEDITGLDGNPVSYNIYEFNNPIGVAGNYTYTFKQ